MAKRNLRAVLLLATLAGGATGWAAEWQSGTRDEDRRDSGQPCGVFRMERGERPHFEPCGRQGPGWDERY